MNFFKLTQNWIKDKKDYLWYKFILKTEFHQSLNLDGVKMVGMSKEERTQYITKLVIARNKAHNIDRMVEETKRLKKSSNIKENS